MKWTKEWKPLAAIVAIFLACYYLPVDFLKGSERLQNAVWESFYLLQDYAREHVLLCLVPAFFIAGAVAVFVSQAAVMKYLGARANKVLAYGVASVSGSVLAVCSCTILPLFAGIYRMGAGLGPATAFLYSGPAINVLAIVLTARVLGPELGIARALGAVVFSIIIGLAMHVIYRREEMDKVKAQADLPEPEVARPLWQNALYFASMVGILVFANWGRPAVQEGLWHAIFSAKWQVTALFGMALGGMLVRWFSVAWDVGALVQCGLVEGGYGGAAGGGLGAAVAAVAGGAFCRRCAGTFGVDQHRVRRDGRLVFGNLGIRQADPAPAAHRRLDFGGAARAPRL